MNYGKLWLRVGLIARLILGGIFIYASVDKLIHPAQFAEIIFNYKILPTQLVNLAAIILPWVELSAGILLVIGRFVWPSSLILTALTLIFIGAISYNLARGLDFQCGCFSTAAEARSTNLATLFRDLALLPAAAICLWSARPSPRVQ